MAWWMQRAARLQEGVRNDERCDAAFSVYGEEEVARATVHTRQDLVLIVSYLSSANEQLATIRWLLMGLVVLVAAIVLRLVF
jgi:hypothetical protein